MSISIMEKAIAVEEYVIEIRRRIHRNPEMGMQEFETTQLIKEELHNMGIKIVALESKIGVLGIIEGIKPGREVVTALRADMDALPIQELTNLSYSSVNEGVMHACGHDCHTAMLLGAAKILNDMRDEFSGVVKLIFQPAEELLIGSRLMISNGVLQNPKVDSIVALHGTADLKLGTVGLYRGPYMASADSFEIKLIGLGGHGAYPHEHKDMILAASHLVVGLQGIVSRRIDAIDSAVLSVCTIHGGSAMNIIPDTVTITGNVRCHKARIRKDIERYMEEITDGISKCYSCRYEYNYNQGIPPLINDFEIVDRMELVAQKVVGQANVCEIEKPAMGSEDFAVYLQEIPKGAFIRLGLCEPGKEPTLFHNSYFEFNEEALKTGVALLAEYVVETNQ